jgi:hypothetical protein
MLLAQVPDEQSALIRHALLSAQGLHASPPQSMSVSALFLVPSKQLADAHTPLEQSEVEQSLLTRQSFPSKHAEQLPPQSTSLSLPLVMPSKHDAVKVPQVASAKPLGHEHVVVVPATAVPPFWQGTQALLMST